MNRKLSRLLDEIQKTEKKIAEWQVYLEELHIRKKQIEDAEIIKSIRSMKLGSREMLTLLDNLRKGTVSIPCDGDGMVSLDGEERGDRKIRETDRVPEETVSESEEQNNEENE